MDALSQKADVKQRVAANPTPLIAAIGGLIGLLVLLRIIRSR